MNEEFTTPEVTQTPEPKLEKQHTFRDEVFETIRFLIIALLIVVPVRIFIAQPFIVSGTSMDPTFKDKQYLIVDELSYHLGDPARGDVVIFKFPRNPQQYFIKRVVGLPGETIRITKGGQVTIKEADGKTTLTLSEPYIVFPKTDDDIERTLKPNEYFMMGDNRGGSFDSRAWGPVNRDLIVGKAFLRLFPVNALSILPGQYRQP
jgi:signal peptidase I